MILKKLKYLNRDSQSFGSYYYIEMINDKNETITKTMVIQDIDILEIRKILHI